MVLANGLRLALSGAVLGITGALSLSSTLAHFLFAVSPFDPLTYVTVTLALIGVARLATYVPNAALRAWIR
jgi:hypothetical protein